MITPDDELLPDDSEPADVEQTSQQQDIHSIGLDDNVEDNAGEIDETDALNRAYDASEPSYTLNLDDEPREDE